ncbi:MAG: glycoside hydrolase family 28 protein [Lachnospiraceae bacterium]|nr:glycoside hydrolase family 28 protein [Lachnospiraceae bacterium]
MLDFEVTDVFCRSVTIERKNESQYQTEEECIVWLDGKEVQRTRHNVITIGNLLPDTEYAISLGDGRMARTIRTMKESFLLNVRDFGAKGDGKTLDTASIQAAIAACPEDGTVYLPKGKYLSGPLFLKSHVTLWIDEGAVLLGDPDRAHYPKLPGVVRHLYENDKEYPIASWEGNPLEAFASLITGIGLCDVNLVGFGTIDGNADQGDWWENVRVKRGAWRPRTIFFSHCQNVRMQSLTVRNSPSWTIHPYYCDHVRLLDLSIWNPAEVPNTDGLDPESCEDLLLLGSRISVGDDCVAIKSGKLYMATYHYKTTKQIQIRNCLLERGHGSVTVGSEIAGGVEDVLVSKCIFRGTDRGVRIKSRRGRGERAVITNMVFENLRMEQVQMPVTVNMFYFCDPDGHTEYVQGQYYMPVDYRTPKIGSLTVKNSICVGVNASLVCAYGLPEAPIEKIELENVQASFLPKEERTATRPIMMDNFDAMNGKSLFVKNVKEFLCKNVTITGDGVLEPEMENVERKDVEGLNIHA